MKKHESREIKIGEVYRWFSGEKKISRRYSGYEGKIYVDYNGFLHNLNGPVGYVSEFDYPYIIHGKIYYSKKDFLEERERLLLEEHREEILNEIVE